MATCGTVHIYGNAINDQLTEGDTRYLRDPMAIPETEPASQGVLTPLHSIPEGPAGPVLCVLVLLSMLIFATAVRFLPGAMSL